MHDVVAPEEERADQVVLSYADTLKESWPAGERAAVGPEASSGELAELLVEPFRRRIADVRQKELWNGVSLVGPQRDDLRVTLRGVEVAAHASRGQQRTIILALKLAERDLLAENDAPAPIVLLDDVFSELDPDRSARALDLLLDRGQVLVTTADESALPSARRRGVPIWQVGDGSLTRAPRVA